MKDKKKIKIIILVIFVLLVIVLILFSTFNKSNKNIVNNTQSNIENQITNSTVNNSSTSNLTEEEKKINEVIVKNLLDYEWLQNNVYIKTDCFGKKIGMDEKQDLEYIKLYDESYDNAPIILIYAECEVANSNQCYILTYENGQIKARSMTEASNHAAHTEYKVNIRQMAIYQKNMYADGESYDIYAITKNGFNKISSIKESKQYVNSAEQCSYYINNTRCTETEYNEIKNKYVVQTARSLEFKSLKESVLRQDFPY